PGSAHRCSQRCPAASHTLPRPWPGRQQKVGVVRRWSLLCRHRKREPVAALKHPTDRIAARSATAGIATELGTLQTHPPVIQVTVSRQKPVGQTLGSVDVQAATLEQRETK